jgi:acyl-CoA thioesterase-1
MRSALIKYAAVLAVLGCSRAGEGGSNAGDSAAAASPQASARNTADTAPLGRYRPNAIILFVGTSLTAGYGLEPEEAYPQLVQQKIDSAGLKFEVVNAGQSGETSSALLRRIRWLLQQPFDVIVIETGANDGLRGIPVATMRQNVQAIIDSVRASRPRAQIVLAQMEAPPNLGVTYTRGFRDVFPELASRNGVALLPFMLEGVAGVRELNQNDGIHPNERGERIVAENVWKGLRPLLQ